MRRQARRNALLTVFGVLLLTLAGRHLRLTQETFTDEAAAPAGEAAAPSSGSSSGGARREERVATLRVAGLDRASGGSTTGRDPWRFLDPPRRIPPTQPASTPPPVQPQAPAADSGLTPPPAEVPLEYLGSFGPAGRKIAVLSDGKRVFNALEGGVVEGRFIVARIGYESVEIRFVDLPGEPARRLGVRRRGA